MTLYNELALEIFKSTVDFKLKHKCFVWDTSELPTMHYDRQCYFYITADVKEHGDIINFTGRKIIPNHQYLSLPGNKQFTIYKLIGVVNIGKTCVDEFNVYICLPLDKTALKNRAVNKISIQTPDCIEKFKSKIASLEEEKKQYKSKDKKYKSIYLQLRELHGRLGFAEMLWEM